MTGPHTTWDKEHLTLKIEGLTGGWTVRQIGEFKLFDYAELQLPHDWDKFKIGATTHIIDTSWRLYGPLVVESALSAGIDYSRADGVGGSVGVDTALKAHLLDRPTVQLDLSLGAKLEGTANREDGYKGSAAFDLKFVLHF